MIQCIEKEQNGYLSTKSEKHKKQYGQYFTSSIISEYMASMIDKVEGVNTLRILDAGAGAGILTASAVNYCMKIGHKCIHAVLYELDDCVLVDLENNMTQLKRKIENRGGEFTFEIKNEDFILSRPDKDSEPFHVSSINPPYFKYNTKTSPYSGRTADLFKGNPNIYASFVSVVGASLAQNGQMIAIIPRSFANGLYFKGFRQFLTENFCLEKIHIFKSRDRVFKELSVLQENIICKFVKKDQNSLISIISSNCSLDLRQSSITNYATTLIIDRYKDNNIIRIPETQDDGRILKTVENWESNFELNGYYISTGPVVEHRTRNYISSQKSSISIPLVRMHNIKPFRNEWTGKHKKDVYFNLIDGYEKHVTRNSVYVMLKRFSSKDEKRRLVAGVNVPTVIPGGLIGFENHLNYIGCVNENMSLEEAFGLAALFNSTFMDKYFRCVSGNTQVNATEIRLLKLPNRKTINEIGSLIINMSNQSQLDIDNVIEKIILNHDYRRTEENKIRPGKIALKRIENAS